MPIDLKEAFENLHDRIMKQIAEKIWEEKRTAPLKGKAFKDFQGKGSDKKEVMKKIKEELEERRENLRVIEKIIKEL